MTKKLYKGFEIDVGAIQNLKTEQWTANVVIYNYKSRQEIDHQYQGPEDTFPTREDALKVGLAYGEWVIDEFPDQLP